MTTDTTLTDDEFLARFADGTLPPALFDHRGHLRLAWIELRRRPLPDAVDNVCTGIERYATRLGAAQKFHRTVTEAIVRLMAARGAADRDAWTTFVADNPDLLRDARAVLARHYSDERLASAEARRGFVTPDREALPV